jgi:hypothetical protein
MDVYSLNLSLLGLTNKDLINNILTVKKNINEIVHNRLYMKNFASKLMELLCEIDELKDFINSEIIQVFLFYLFKRKLIYTNVSDQY